MVSNNQKVDSWPDTGLAIKGNYNKSDVNNCLLLCVIRAMERSHGNLWMKSVEFRSIEIECEPHV